MEREREIKSVKVYIAICIKNMELNVLWKFNKLCVPLYQTIQ